MGEDSLKGLGSGLRLPDEVVGLLEGGSASLDLVDEVLNTDDVMLLQGSLNDEVGSQGNSGVVDLSIPSLVHELGDGASVGGTVGDPRLDDSEHVHDSLVVTEEDGVVDLSESEEAQDLLRLGGHGVDTLHSHDQENLGFSQDEDGAGLLGGTGLVDDGLLAGLIGLEVGLAALEPLLLELLDLYNSGLSGLHHLGVQSLVSLLLQLHSSGDGFSEVRNCLYSWFISFLRFIRFSLLVINC